MLATMAAPLLSTPCYTHRLSMIDAHGGFELGSLSMQA